MLFCSIYRKLQYHHQPHIGIVYSSLLAKSYLFQHTNKNFATPCVVHKKLLSLMASVCAFFVSTKVIPVFHFAALQSKLSTPSLAQLAVGSRAHFSPSFLEVTTSFRSPYAGCRHFFLIALEWKSS